MIWEPGRTRSTRSESCRYTTRCHVCGHLANYVTFLGILLSMKHTRQDSHILPCWLTCFSQLIGSGTATSVRAEDRDFADCTFAADEQNPTGPSRPGACSSCFDSCELIEDMVKVSYERAEGVSTAWTSMWRLVETRCVGRCHWVVFRIVFI